MPIHPSDQKRRVDFDRLLADFNRAASAVLKLPPVRQSSDRRRNVDWSNPNTLLASWEAAEVLGIAKHTLDNRRTSGERTLPFVRIGNKVRYRRSDLDAFVKENTFKSTSEYGDR